MFDNIDLKVIGNSNEWISWIEEAIAKKHIKYYDYNHFNNIQEIGSGGFGKVCRANWKSSLNYLALRSFFDFNNITVKEIVNEVIIIYTVNKYFCFYDILQYVLNLQLYFKMI